MKKKRLRGLLAFLCGAALILWGVSLLWTIPDTMIYVIDAPIVTANGGELGKKLLRVGHIGYHPHEDQEQLVLALKDVLNGGI